MAQHLGLVQRSEQQGPQKLRRPEPHMATRGRHLHTQWVAVVEMGWSPGHSAHIPAPWPAPHCLLSEARPAPSQVFAKQSHDVPEAAENVGRLPLLRGKGLKTGVWVASRGREQRHTGQEGS